MIGDAAEYVDRTLGDRIERLVRAHHARRLAGAGWERALAPGDGLWAAGDPPPRAGNTIDVLVDGVEALPALADALAGAKSHVHLAGWHFSPGFALKRGSNPVVLGDLLAELAERIDVRVLAWAGAPLPVFRPSRSDAERVCAALGDCTRVRAALDAKERPMHCHHEKIAVIDDEVAFVGGLDLTYLDGDRFDAPEHRVRASIGWHDVAVGLRGPAVRDVAEHFRLRWKETTGEALPEPASSAAAGGGVEAQVVRTVSEGIYDALPRGDFRILEVYARAFREARSLIYLENQFLWSPEVVTILADKLRDPPTDEFRVVLLLPAKPNSGADDTRGQLGVLIDADGEGGRLLAATVYSLGGGEARPVYVHAKVGIVDDEWLTVGSANVNEHSLFNDTEMNVVVRDGALARATRERLWAEHLERPLEQLAGREPAELVDEVWEPIAREQLERRKAGLRQTHRLTRLPHVSRRSRRFLGPIQSLLVDG